MFQAEKRIPFCDATNAQLRAYAVSYLGLAVGSRASNAEIIALIKQASPDESVITVSIADTHTNPKRQEPVPFEEKVAKSNARRGWEEGDYFSIVVNRTDDEGGAVPIPVSVNGVTIMVPRGTPVDLPARYVESLRNAVNQVSGATQDGVLESRPVQSYPFSTLNGPFKK